MVYMQQKPANVEAEVESPVAKVVLCSFSRRCCKSGAGVVNLQPVKCRLLWLAQAAVAAIVEADALVAPRWRSLEALVCDTQSLFELGMLSTARSLMQAQEEMMALVKCEHCLGLGFAMI